MKNNYGRFKIIVLISFILLLFVITLEASAGNTTNPLENPPLQQEVNGIVTGPQGQPLAGVAVYIKGEAKGTVTNMDGEYAIRAAPGDILVFSYLGFKPVEVVLQEEDNINIRMEEDVSSLGEVEINAGYYNTTRRESTGNISRVTAEEIERQPVTNPLAALQGRMAGVEIVPNGSEAGAAYTIRIRGRNSLREEGNFPLYIIDGVPINSVPVETIGFFGSTGMDPLNNLDLSNIKSIEVLKDADATAIYGSRGANGVVLITTKKGSDLNSGIQARIYTGVSTLPNRLDLLNTSEYLQIRRRAFENDGVEPNEFNAYDLVLWNQDRYTDWQDFFLGGKSEMTNAQLSASGGNESTSFRLGGSFHNQGTIYPADNNYKKVTGTVNVNHRSKDENFKINFSANYGLDSNELIGDVSFSSNAFSLPPNAPAVFNEDGGLNWEDWAQAGLDNPLSGYYNKSKIETNNLIANLGLSYTFFQNLTLRTSFGYTHYDSEELLKRPSRSYNPADQETHSSSHLNNQRTSWIIEPQVTYNASFGDANLEVLFGTTFQESGSSSLKLQGRGYVSEGLIGNLDTAENILNASSPNSKYRYTAIFSRIGIDWKERYFVNFTGRRDGSSRFGPDNRFANFGAVGAAWIFAEKSSSEEGGAFLSFGKLRGSYGTTGNDQIGDYGYLDAYEATDGPGGLYPTALSNPAYSWEVSRKMEGGIDLGLFRDRIFLGISWYRNRSSNQLVGYPLPMITGFNVVQANLPATVQNTGWEFELNSQNVRSKSFSWQSSINLTIPRNELINYPGLDQSSYANVYRIGHPLDISLRYNYQGLDPVTGFYTIEDINGDERFDYQDKMIIQDHGRTFYGGVNNNLNYKSISLEFLWEFVKQEGSFSSFGAGAPRAQRRVVLQALDQNSRFQTISQSRQASTAYGYALDSALPIEDASFLRLKSLSLGYIIPQSFLHKIGMEAGKFFLHGQNLLTITPYPGLDPERPYAGTSFGSLQTITAGLEFNL